MSKLENQGKFQDSHISVKVVFVGDFGVGKTSLISRECDDYFSQSQLATLGIDYRQKIYKIQNTTVRAQLWDTAGQQKFNSIQNPYFRNAKAVCLCFSLNNKNSFTNLNKWIDKLNELNIPKDTMILIGCKNDVDIVEVHIDQIVLFAEKYGLEYFFYFFGYGARCS